MENTITTTPKERAAELTSRINANAAIAAQTLVAIGRDLKIMRDEKLYTELGCADFGEYCDKHTQVRQRQAYNFIKAFETYGERLSELSGLGITKLALLSALDEEEREELIENGDAEKMSTRELENTIAELKKQNEQLTLDMGELDANKTETEEKMEKLAKEIEVLKQSLQNAEEKNKELENRPVEVAVQKPDETVIEKIKADAKKEAEKAVADAEKKHKAALDKLRDEMKDRYDNERIEAVDTARKEQFAEIERLKAENTALQANAKKSAPSDAKSRIKFYMAEMQNTFNSAIEVVREVGDEAEKESYKKALKTILETLGGAVDGI